MDSIFGLVGDGFAIIAADCSAGRSILVYQHDVDKIVQLDSHKLIAGAGVAADSSNFTEYIQKNLKLYELNNDMKMNTNAAAYYTRGVLAKALRKGPYQTNLLLAGYDKAQGISLFFMDYFAALAKVNFGAQGYAANFVLSVMDRDWQPNMTLEQGVELIKKCLHELKTRFLLSQPVFKVKVVDASGIRTIEI